MRELRPTEVVVDVAETVPPSDAEILRLVRELAVMEVEDPWGTTYAEGFTDGQHAILRRLRGILG